MIAFVEGRLEYIEDGACVLDVGGVGYRVFTPMSDISAFAPGTELRLYTYLNVREDAMLLYGFLSRDSLEVFKQLINVSGVGPKFALAILNSFSAAELVGAIATENTKALSSVSGIGKKTAERIILELKDKIHLSSESVEIDFSAPKAAGVMSPEAAQAVTVLLSLGYGQGEASAAVTKVYQEGMSAEEIIEECMTNVF